MCDSLSDREQAIARAQWDRQIAERIDSLDLEAEFTAAGESWSESDDDGRLVIRSPSPTQSRELGQHPMLAISGWHVPRDSVRMLVGS